MTQQASPVAAADDAPWRALYPAGVSADAADLPNSALEMVQAAMQHRDRIALQYFDAAMSYGMLDDLSDRLAQHWHDAGVALGDRVAIILQNVPQFAVATVAAWKIGAVPVTMNPMYRASELSKLFADCTPRAILCHDDHHAEVSAACAEFAPLSCLTTSPHDFQQRDDARVLPPRPAARRQDDLLALLETVEFKSLPAFTTASDDMALLLYTSGTTGTPKGAMLTHRNLVSNAAFCRDWCGLDADSRIFGVAPLFHITGFACHLCAAFITGARVIMTYRFAPDVAIDAFREHRPTFTIGAITAFVALMQTPSATAEDLASFQGVYSGGAPVPPTIVTQFAERFGKHIRSCYGMTETTAPALFSPPEGTIPVDAESGAISVGLPIPGTTIRIVGEDGEPAPVGVAGEVVIHGPQVMKGYWRRPEETAEVLTDGWMRSGDVGFRDAQGWFYLVDRKKDMIVASGFKVWPREVEDVLYAHPAVREVAVVGKPDAYRGETVLAYLSFKAGASVTSQELVAWCRERLAAYKCPREIVVMPDLPKTVSGKIMRAELRKTAQADVTPQPQPKRPEAL